MVTGKVSGIRPVDRVVSATMEWGYRNFYRYHWAGRADSAMAELGRELWLYGDVGINAGGDRDSDEWVGVTRLSLPVVGGVFTGGSSTFRVPSWAPASSPEIARWSCRAVVERTVRDIDAYGDFVVRVNRAEATEDDGGVEVIMGDGETVIDIELVSSVFVAGEVIRGQVRLTPTRNLPDGDIGVCWRRSRESHPLTRTPSRGQAIDGPNRAVAERVRLRAGEQITLPFELALPADAAPTANAVHSSMRWSVHARLFYSGLSAHLTERVLRPIIVVNDP
jgi:hypothetical protein